MIAMMRCVLIVYAVVALAPTSALAQDDELPSVRKLATVKKVCERAWHKQEEPRDSVTRLCARYWLFAYNYSLREARDSGLESALSAEPKVTGVEVTRFTRAQFLAMAKHARKMPRRTRKGDDWIAIRAREYFEGAARSKVTLQAQNACSGNLDCLLQRIFDDGALEERTLSGLDAQHLRILWHAVYARHGRRFKSRDMYRLFYGNSAEANTRRLLPRTPESGFSDDMLSDTDRANIALIEKLEKKLRKDFRQRTPIFLREGAASRAPGIRTQSRGRPQSPRTALFVEIRPRRRMTTTAANFSSRLVRDDSRSSSRQEKCSSPPR